MWTYQKYDWKGRVVRTINTDGVDSPTLNDSDVLISYEGCGCAGGQVTTIQGENIVETDWQGNNPVTLGRRTQKVYEDILGRSWKTEVLNWNGSVYSTNTIQFNGRDQALSATLTEQSTSISQVTSMTYDGHGRLRTQHRPEQRDSSNNLKYTTYNYNADDSITSVVDGRGAVKNLSYNSRGLVEEISYSVPSGSTITVPAAAGFTYDALGNRTSMTDGLGTVGYSYDELSRLTSETRDFTDTLADAPANNYVVEYTYTLSGQLKSLKDPFGQQFNYVHDKAARLQSVSGSASFNGVTVYANNTRYNARGQLTGVVYGNGTEMNITGFNGKLQAASFEVKKGSANLIKKQYQFLSDGSLKFSKDEIDGKFDRLYKYDVSGQTTATNSGLEARGGTAQDSELINVPYKMDYTHNAFGQITHFGGRYYNSYEDSTHAYVNNRDLNEHDTFGPSYDGEGNSTRDLDGSYKYDAAGLMHETTATDVDDPNTFTETTKSWFNGVGELEKRTRNYGSTAPAPITNYYIRSTILRRVISEVGATGKKQKTYVPANGVTLAEQELVTTGSTISEKLSFIHQDASGASVQQTNAAGDPVLQNARTGEYDALGRNVADAGPYWNLDTNPPTGEGYRPGRAPSTAASSKMLSPAKLNSQRYISTQNLSILSVMGILFRRSEAHSGRSADMKIKEAA